MAMSKIRAGLLLSLAILLLVVVLATLGGGEGLAVEEGLVCRDHRVLVRERGPRFPRSSRWHTETRYLCFPESSPNA
jgi:hypothetical protein